MAEVKVFPKIAQIDDAQALQQRWQNLGWTIPCDDDVLTERESPLAQPLQIYDFRVGNRWCVHPMEGWDGTADGKPSEWTMRRWERFGRSGAKLIWGCEAVAVQHDGRANPNQLMINEDTLLDLGHLRERLVAAHCEQMGSADDLLIGLQLTHSGRFSKPNDHARMEPRIAYHHPILDARLGIAPDDDSVVLSDDDLKRLSDQFVQACKLAARAGFSFVDLKCCHGYLGHELLSGFTRPGQYGGSFENRTRFIRELIQRVQNEVPTVRIGVRLSAFDIVPFEDDPATRVGNKKGAGMPTDYSNLLPYRYGFGVNQDDPTTIDLTEPMQFLDMLQSLDVRFVNVTCGSPYYNPHIQRPAYFPPSDGYQPPEDPLAGVARQIDVVRQLKERFPQMVLVGTGYTYLQEFLPAVAQAVVRAGWADLVGIGRGVLSYPEMPYDSLVNGQLDAKRICRTFSDCTTAPRKGMVSGCYPLDEAYRNCELGQQLRAFKKHQEEI